jgi:undecaprenyl diphosphate synthase
VNDLPQHVAVILDGNRRWEKQRGLPSGSGHREGFETLLKMVDAALERRINILTAYVFSTENWQRTSEEVGVLMSLLKYGLNNYVKAYHQRGIRLQFWGSRRELDAKVAKALDAAEELTAGNSAAQLNICFNYGGRRDIVEGVNRALAAGAKSLDEDSLAQRLSSAGTPDPDLIIRTSGEQRLSNFLIWEGAYSELYFADLLWPDFDEAELDRALAEFARRKRRYGK